MPGNNQHKMHSNQPDDLLTNSLVSCQFMK